MRRSQSRIFALALGIPLLLAILTACGAGTSTGSGGATPSSGPIILKIATELATAEQRIYHDADHPSALVLPVISREECSVPLSLSSGK